MTISNISSNGEQEKEYSIEQFQKDYSQLVEEKVVPILLDYENERKTRLKWAIIIVTVLSIIGVILLFCVEERSGVKLALFFISGAVAIWQLIKKNFENKIKPLIMPTLMKAIPGFYWKLTPPVTQDEISESKIIPFTDRAHATFDDCFLGEYRNVNIAISECEYTISSGKSTSYIFTGIVIRIDMNKNFDGCTVIRPRNPHYRDKHDDLKRANLSEVKLEDPEFADKYIVYSTDQIEARYLITTSFMERFKAVEEAFGAQYTYCSFYGDSVYIAPDTAEDMFSLCSLTSPIYNTEQFETLFNEFASVLELVDHFKLDKKLGL